MATTLLIPLVDGFEEIEAVVAIDLLRRAGIEVRTAGFGRAAATGSHAITVETDMLMADAHATDFDGIVLPGGPGTRTLLADKRVASLVREFAGEGKLVAAICAAPAVLARAGLLAGRRAACFPSVEGELRDCHLSHDAVVVDGGFITSRGAGTAIQFALAIVAWFQGQPASDALARQILFEG